MNKYKVMVVGLGKRGCHHITHFNAHPDFKVTAVCDIRHEAIDNIVKELDSPITGTDAREVALKAKPDVFCFCTLPDIRSEMISIAIEAGAGLIAFEKPVALTTIEGAKIKEMIEASKDRAIPKWLKADLGNLKGEVIAMPDRDDVGFPIREQLIVELYSK